MNLKCWNNKDVLRKTGLTTEQHLKKCSFQTKMQLLLVKMAYFVLLGALAGLYPYLPLFMGVLRLTPIQMSIIIGVSTASSSPVRLAIGYLADRFQKRTLVYSVSSIVSALFYASLYFTPSGDVATGNKACFHVNYSIENLTSNLLLTNISKLFDESTKCCTNESDKVFVCNRSHGYELDNQTLKFLCLDSCNITTQLFISNFSNKYKTFIIFFILYFLAQIAFSPLQSILDSLIHVTLIRANKSSEFGACRVWGSIGFGICSFLSGLMIDLLSRHGWTGRSIFILNFVFLILGLVLSSVITIFIAHSGSRKNHKTITDIHVETVFIERIEIISNDSGKKSIFPDKKEMIEIFCTFYFSIILLTGMVSGTIVGSTEGFFYYFLTSLDSENKFAIGVCLAVACVSESIFLYFSGKIIKRLGYQRCLYVVFTGYCCRMMAASFITNPWFGPLIDVIQGLCFGILYPVMSTWASTLVPRELHSTVQCYIGAVYYDMGRAVGTTIGGVIYELFGPRIMFRSIAAVSFVYLILLIFIFEVIDKVRHRRQIVKEIPVKESETV